MNPIIAYICASLSIVVGGLVFAFTGSVWWAVPAVPVTVVVLAVLHEALRSRAEPRGNA